MLILRDQNICRWVSIVCTDKYVQYNIFRSFAINTTITKCIYRVEQWIWSINHPVLQGALIQILASEITSQILRPSAFWRAKIYSKGRRCSALTNDRVPSSLNHSAPLPLESHKYLRFSSSYMINVTILKYAKFILLHDISNNGDITTTPWADLHYYWTPSLILSIKELFISTYECVIRLESSSTEQKIGRGMEFVLKAWTWRTGKSSAFHYSLAPPLDNKTTKAFVVVLRI